MMNILLILYSGKKNDALSVAKDKFQNINIDIVTKSYLKSLKLVRMIYTLRRKDVDQVIIFCDNLYKQHNIFLLKFLGLVTKAEIRRMMDSEGNVLSINPQKVILLELPLFFLSWGSVILALLLVNVILIFFICISKILKKRGHRRFNKQSKENIEVVYLRTDYAFETAGGAVSHIAGFGNAMINLKHRLIFISAYKLFGFEGQKVSHYIVKPIFFFNKIAVEISQLVYNMKVVFNALKILKNYKPDLIYQRSSTFNCSGVLLSFILRKPFILEFNSSAMWKTDKDVKHRFKITRFFIEKLNLDWADKIMVVSEIMCNQLKRRINYPDRIVTNPNGADPNVFNPNVEKRNLKKEFGIFDKVIVGFAGSLYQWHGLETLVGCIKYVARENKKIHFMIMGDGVYREKLEMLAEKDAISSLITFTGLIPKQEMPEYLNACDILVSPHRNMAGGQAFFGSPVKLFEYMAMAKPIIASKVGQLLTVLEDKKNAILVPPDDKEHLARAILKLASNSDLRKKLGKRARFDLDRSYTWTCNAKRVVDAYNHIVEFEPPT